MSENAPAAEKGRIRLLDWLDSIAKILGASAVLWVALLANSLQSRLTGISVQSQREQAESQLRANMFNSLISPIVGSQKTGQISVENEQLLAELLVLNFNENFELKPLMEHVSTRLLHETRPTLRTSDTRESLWSIARRISERQRASIAREWEASTGNGKRSWPMLRTTAHSDPEPCKVYEITVSAGPRHSDKIQTGQPGHPCKFLAAFTDTVEVRSQDGKYKLLLWPQEADWKNQTVNLSVQPYPSEQEGPRATDTNYAFTLTWFDLPLTDNTLLPDGNRFAIYLRIHDKPREEVTFVVMWFPKGYFTPRERPLNYREVQQLLGRKEQ